MMNKLIRVCLFGKHGNRSPLSYPCYRQIYEERGVKFVESLDQCDVAVTGFRADLLASFNDLYSATERNSGMQVCVFSEEPLWDILWSPGFKNAKAEIIYGDRKISYHNVNHATASFFSGESLPYFITTDDRYFSRYSFLFKQNAGYGKDEITKQWDNSTWDCAFVAEKRDEPRYEVDDSEVGYLSLSRFRTGLAAGCKALGSTLVEGKGWESDVSRQALADWHLDKVSLLRQNARMMSALENTSVPFYVTEKVFDAFSCLAVPLIYAGQLSGYENILLREACIEFDSRDLVKAEDTLSSWLYDDEFVDNYRAAQSILASLFSDVRVLANSRYGYASKAHVLLEEVLS